MKAISRWRRIGIVTTALPFIFSSVATFESSWFLLFRKEKGYELEKTHSPWLRSNMCFRSLNCDGADERAWWFDAPDGNARPSDFTFDGTDADAARSHAKLYIRLSPSLLQRSAGRPLLSSASP